MGEPTSQGLQVPSPGSLEDVCVSPGDGEQSRERSRAEWEREGHEIIEDISQKHTEPLALLVPLVQ